MEFGVQRRSICLTPARSEELAWVFRLFDHPEVWRRFGFSGPGRLRIMRAFRLKQLILGVIRRVADEKAIGCVVMFPPTADFDFWEFGYVIPDPADRDAFSALNTTDAMAHYVFDHVGIEAAGWRTQEGNRAADAVVRRLGYKPFGAWEVDGHRYTFYRLDRPTWEARRRRLEAGEAKHPSGIGAAFATLREPPYAPLKPSGPLDAEPQSAE